jgi:hypothetical protein
MFAGRRTSSGVLFAEVGTLTAVVATGAAAVVAAVVTVGASVVETGAAGTLTRAADDTAAVGAPPAAAVGTVVDTKRSLAALPCSCCLLLVDAVVFANVSSASKK